MAATPMRGAGILLPATFQQPNPSNSQGAPATVAAGPLSLAAGEVFHIPAGQWYITPGPYTFFQARDPLTGIWRTPAQDSNSGRCVTSDGVNFRLANLTGCAIGGYVTTVGSGYTSAPTVTASAGASTWTAIVGGAVNSTVTVGTAGAGYTFPPQVVISPPPAGGVQATAVATLSTGTVSAVTVINQGAGYPTAPTITFIPDPRDTGPTTNAAATTTLTGSGTITAVLCTGHGTPLTSVPTLTFSGGGGSSAAATVVMCFTLTGYTVGTAGVAYGNAQPILTQAVGGIVGGAAGAVVNPAISTGLLTPRMGLITSTSTAGGALTTGGVIQDGGLFQAVPVSITSPGNAVPTTQAVATLTVGGVTDTSYIVSF